jgi:hypothetical protein
MTTLLLLEVRVLVVLSLRSGVFKHPDLHFPLNDVSGDRLHRSLHDVVDNNGRLLLQLALLDWLLERSPTTILLNYVQQFKHDFLTKLIRNRRRQRLRL